MMRVHWERVHRREADFALKNPDNRALHARDRLCFVGCFEADTPDIYASARACSCLVTVVDPWLKASAQPSG